jgi:hypothetical protein
VFLGTNGTLAAGLPNNEDISADHLDVDHAKKTFAGKRFAGVGQFRPAVPVSGCDATRAGLTRKGDIALLCMIE